MHRIDFLISNVEVARSIVDELLEQRIERRWIYTTANRSVKLEGLLHATLLEGREMTEPTTSPVPRCVMPIRSTPIFSCWAGMGGAACDVS